MRPTLLLVLAVAVRPAVAADNAFPTAFEASRYEAMMKDSPFALATAAATPETPPEKFSENWKVTIFGNFPDADGETRDWVVIRSQDQRVAFTLRGKEVGKEGDAAGVTIDRIEWNESEPRKSRVYLRKDNKVEAVEMAQDTAATSPPPGMLPPGARPGAIMPNAPGTIRLPGQPGAVPRSTPFGSNVPGRPPIAPIKPGLPRPPAGPAMPPGMPQPNAAARPAGPVPAPGLQQSGPPRKPRVIPSVPVQ